MGLFIGCTCDWDADETCEKCNPVDYYGKNTFDPKTDPHVLLDKNVPEFKESDRENYVYTKAEQSFIAKWKKKLDADLESLNKNTPRKVTNLLQEAAETRDMNAEGFVKKEKKPLNPGDAVEFVDGPCLYTAKVFRVFSSAVTGEYFITRETGPYVSRRQVLKVRRKKT